MPVELVVSTSDSFDGSDGSSTIDNKAALCLNHGLQWNQFVGRPVEVLLIFIMVNVRMEPNGSEINSYKE